MTTLYMIESGLRTSGGYVPCRLPTIKLINIILIMRVVEKKIVKSLYESLSENIGGHWLKWQREIVNRFLFS